VHPPGEGAAAGHGRSERAATASTTQLATADDVRSAKIAGPADTKYAEPDAETAPRDTKPAGPDANTTQLATAADSRSAGNALVAGTKPAQSDAKARPDAKSVQTDKASDARSAKPDQAADAADAQPAQAADTSGGSPPPENAPRRVTSTGSTADSVVAEPSLFALRAKARGSAAAGHCTETRAIIEQITRRDVTLARALRSEPAIARCFPAK
jgi:hypothetical protein